MRDSIKILLKILAVCFIIFIFYATLVLFFEEASLRYELEQELKANNASCEIERGIFNIPLSKTCTYSILKEAGKNGARDTN